MDICVLVLLPSGRCVLVLPFFVLLSFIIIIIMKAKCKYGAEGKI